MALLSLAPARSAAAPADVSLLRLHSRGDIAELEDTSSVGKIAPLVGARDAPLLPPWLTLTRTVVVELLHRSVLLGAWRAAELASVLQAASPVFIDFIQGDGAVESCVGAGGDDQSVL